MLDFHVITLEDREWIRPCLERSGYMGCEYSFANNFAWHRLSDTRITHYKDFYISASFKNRLKYTFPSGSGDLRELFGVLGKDSAERGCPLCIGSVTPDKIHIFDEIFGKNYEISTDPADWDYVYNTSDLAELGGRKYHGKRNHLKKLLEREHTYSPLTEKDFDECIEFAVREYNKSREYDDHSRVCEQFAINAFFEHFFELGLTGGVLRTDGVMAGFTIGDRINKDTYGVHIEKARTDIDGAYQAINNYFAKDNLGYRYLNREEDLGVEGLRKAKRSYHPAFMVEKYTVTVNS